MKKLISNILTLKDDQLPEYITTQWQYSDVWESFICVYKRENIKSFFSSKKYEYVLIGLEYVSSHWGIQKACMGDWDFKSKLLENLSTQGIYPTPKEVETSSSKASNICFDIEENQIFVRASFDDPWKTLGDSSIERFRQSYPQPFLIFKSHS